MYIHFMHYQSAMDYLYRYISPQTTLETQALVKSPTPTSLTPAPTPDHPMPPRAGVVGANITGKSLWNHFSERTELFLHLDRTVSSVVVYHHSIVFYPLVNMVFW